jgi:hypothetical protein
LHVKELIGSVNEAAGVSDDEIHTHTRLIHKTNYAWNQLVERVGVDYFLDVEKYCEKQRYVQQNADCDPLLVVCFKKEGNSNRIQRQGHPDGQYPNKALTQQCL